MTRDLRHQILRAAVRDRAFLKAAWRDVLPDNFPDKEESLIAKAAVEFYEKYEEPIGAMLKSEVEDLAAEERFGSESKSKLKALIEMIQGVKMEPVSVRALVDRVKSLAKDSFYDNAVDEIVSAQEAGKLTAQTLADLVERAQKQLHSNGFQAVNYLEDAELEKRINRRDMWENEKHPLLLINPFDEKVKAIGRGHFGIFVAPPSGGKGLALIWITVAYALQGLNVLHFSLEDPKDTVENRLDSSITGIPLNRLRSMPDELRKKFRKIKKRLRGRIKLVDGTDSEWTVTRIERAWEEEKQAGFIADAIVVDYDDEIQCEKQFKGDSARRMEFAEIYKRLRRLAAKTNTIVWSAAQTAKSAEGRKVITGKDIAEDYSKVRKVFLAISIGSDPTDENLKYLHILKHRLDRSRFTIEIMSDYNSAIFFNQEGTRAWQKEKKMLEP